MCHGMIRCVATTTTVVSIATRARRLGDHDSGIDDAPGPDHETFPEINTPLGQARILKVVADDVGLPGMGLPLVTADHIVTAAKQVDDLPLPSSPHCAPTTTVAGTYDSLPERYGRRARRFCVQLTPKHALPAR